MKKRKTRKPAYRQQLHRFSRFEDAVLEVIRKFESEKDKDLLLRKLEEIRR